MNKRSFVVAGGLWLCGLVIVAQGAAQYAKPTAAVDTPTFTKDVAPILYKNCTNCHRPGEIAPMSLLTFKDARPWAKSIREKVSLGLMPPWHADPTHGEFLNDRRLSDAEKDTVIKWVAAGAPEGNPADLPAQPTYAEGWLMGQPDVVLGMNEDYPIPASGTVDYKYFEVPTNFTQDTYVQAMEVRAGTRTVVHHVIVFARAPQPPPLPPDAPRPQPQPAVFKFAEGMGIPKKDETTKSINDRPAPQRLGQSIGGFAPGQFVRVYQPGTAIRIPAGSVLVFQVHYTANGTATTDRTTIGLKLAKEKPKDEVRMSALINGAFTIPAGEGNHRVDAELTLVQDITLWSMLPHTHVRGKRWEYQVMYPDGRSETLLSVPKYDFNWQTDYIFKEPLKLPKGTKIHATAWYDNSANNPSNPNPSLDVKWGDQTWEEMMFTSLNYTVNTPPATPTVEGKPGGQK
jgi:hypothetical protein